MPGQDGDGWARCDLGHRHWGRFGAVGLLAYQGSAAQPGVLLVRRNRGSQHGGTWGPPGGARDSEEPPLTAALREAWEECALPGGEVSATGMLLDDHGGWSYQTFLAQASGRLPVHAASYGITGARWVDAAEVTSLPLHPGFGEHWPVLRGALAPVTIVVDAANVMGSRPDGWWRDRAGAALRLHGQLDALSRRGLPSLPGELAQSPPAQSPPAQSSPALPPLTLWFPDFVLVVEGAARRAEFGPAERVRVVSAPGSGDDAIVAAAAGVPAPRLVVTADRELRRRCQAVGAAVTGPGWLLGQLV
ncbi:MAG: NUDIX domain-containing protein [Streptosporangiaceae bacterium]